MFSGVFNRTVSSISPSLRTDLLSVLNSFGQAHVCGAWQDSRFLLAQTLIHNTPESYNEATPYHCPRSGLVVAAWARLDQRDALAAELGLDLALSKLTDPMLILAAWQRWGTDCATHLQGDFSFAIVDPERQTLFLARDPVGVRPLYYRLGLDVCQFATTAAVFSRIDSWRAEPDRAWIARYLLPMGPLSRHSTAWRDVLKLEPGHWLMVSPERSDLQRYHYFQDDAPFSLRRDERWVKEYRLVLERVIQDQMRSAHKLGVENSGGIDSATLTAFIARELGEPGERLTSFGFALFDQEPALILETSQVHRIVHNHIFTQLPAKTDEDYTRSLAVLGFPGEHGTATLHIPFYRLCQNADIRTLYSGFGGDEVVTNPGYHLHCELLDRGDYLALLDVLPGTLPAQSLRLLKAIATHHRCPTYSLPLRKAFLERWPLQILQQHVVDEFALFEEGLESMRYDAPYRRINDFALSGRLYTGFVPTRLENCSLVAESYGIDYRWPLLDTRLIQQYLSTPSIEKFGPKAMGRYLHRRAIDGVVPHNVAWKPSKHMGYAGGRGEWHPAELGTLAKEARRQETYLHPMLDEMIDRQKFREQINLAAQGGVDKSFFFVFRRSTEAIRWLNHWLYGHPVD